MEDYQFAYCIYFQPTPENFKLLVETETKMEKLLLDNGLTLTGIDGGMFIGSPVRDLSMFCKEQPSESVIKQMNEIVSNSFRIATDAEIDQIII